MWRKLANPAPASSTAIRTSDAEDRHRATEDLVVLDGDMFGHLEHNRTRSRREIAPAAPLEE